MRAPSTSSASTDRESQLGLQRDYRGRVSNPNNPAATAALDIKTSYFPLLFLLGIFKTLVIIDGQDMGPIPWGTHRFPVTPGQHTVKLSARYLFYTNMMANETTVMVGSGQAVGVSYKAPWLVFLKGKITVTPPVG